MKFKEQVYKYLFWGLVILVLIPIFLGTFQNDIFGFTRGEFLDYYGSILSNLITFIALIITINHSNKDRKQDFNFQITQKNISEFEGFIRKICLGLMFKYELFNKITKIPLELFLNNNNIKQLNIDNIYEDIFNAFIYLDKMNFNINLYKNELNLYIYDYFCDRKIIENYINLLNKEIEKYLTTLDQMKNIVMELQKIIYNIKISGGIVNIEQNNLFSLNKFNLNNFLIERSNYEKNEYKEFLNKTKEFLQLVEQESIKIKNNLDN